MMSKLAVLVLLPLALTALAALAEAELSFFDWNVTRELGPDNKLAIKINGEIPGDIRLELGTEYIFAVTSSLANESLSIDWGIQQVTPSSGGADDPIVFGETRRYHVKPEQVGNFPYQAVSPMQTQDGFRGSFVVSPSSVVSP